ncbi:hypothetical protein STEG23_025807 [Scotinomys teguina]
MTLLASADQLGAMKNLTAHRGTQGISHSNSISEGDKTYLLTPSNTLLFQENIEILSLASVEPIGYNAYVEPIECNGERFTQKNPSEKQTYLLFNSFMEVIPSTCASTTPPP